MPAMRSRPVYAHPKPGRALYWTGGGDGSTVAKIALDGSGPITTLATGQTSPLGIAVDGAAVYWTTNTNPGTVMKIAK